MSFPVSMSAIPKSSALSPHACLAMQRETWFMVAVQCDAKACYLLLVNFHASLGDCRGEITGRSLTFRCRAGGSGCGGPP